MAVRCAHLTRAAECALALALAAGCHRRIPSAPSLLGLRVSPSRQPGRAQATPSSRAGKLLTCDAAGALGRHARRVGQGRIHVFPRLDDGQWPI